MNDPTLYVDDLRLYLKGYLDVEWEESATWRVWQVVPQRCPSWISHKPDCPVVGCDDKAWLYPPPPDWWETDENWSYGFGRVMPLEDWQDFCLVMWRAMGIMEPDDD